MTSTTSPILDFYPGDFDMDLNGKRQDWEAVVKIPFIDEKRLLDAMKTYEHRLSKEEKKRAKFGDSFKFVFDASLATKESVYPSSLPGIFPDIHHCMSREEVFHLPTLDGGLSFRNHLLDGVQLGKDALAGFPSLNTVPHTGELRFHNVNVFQQESKYVIKYEWMYLGCQVTYNALLYRNETMVVTLENQYEDVNIEEIAKNLLYKRIYVRKLTLRIVRKVGLLIIFGTCRLSLSSRSRRHWCI